MDPVTPPGVGNDPVWTIIMAVAGFLAVTVMGWLKFEMTCLRRDHDRLDERVDAAERNIEARAAYCAATSDNVGKFMVRIEAKLDRLVEGRSGRADQE